MSYPHFFAPFTASTPTTSGPCLVTWHDKDNIVVGGSDGFVDSRGRLWVPNADTDCVPCSRTTNDSAVGRIRVLEPSELGKNLLRSSPFVLKGEFFEVCTGKTANIL